MLFKFTGAIKESTRYCQSESHLQTISETWQFYGKLVNLRILIVTQTNFWNDYNLDVF